MSADKFAEAAYVAEQLRTTIYGLSLDPEVRAEMLADLNFIASQLRTTGASVRRRAERAAEALRVEVGDRVVEFDGGATMTIMPVQSYPLCAMSQAQLDGLACIDCNRPASDGPMVPLFEGSGLFRCSPDLGCLPQKLVP